MPNKTVLYGECVQCNALFETLSFKRLYCDKCRLNRDKELITASRRKKAGAQPRGNHYTRRTGEALERNRQSRRKMKYKLTEDIFEQLLDLQDDRCAICGHLPAPDEEPLAVDHDHLTGFNRGLLCRSCNHGLGCFRDSSEFLRAAALYLEYTPMMALRGEVDPCLLKFPEREKAPAADRGPSLLLGQEALLEQYLGVVHG